MPACGVTETLYGNQVKDIVTQEYGTSYDLNKDFVRLPAATGQAGGCGCMKKPAQLLPSSQQQQQPLKQEQLGGGTCSGGTPMLRALGIMAGGKRRGSGRTKRAKRNSTKKSACKCQPFFGGRGRGYKPTARNLATLRKYKAGKSIGFTMRSSLKAKGLIPRSNGTYKVSRKYR